MLRGGLSFSWIHLLKFVLLGKLADGVVVFSLIVIRVIGHDSCACTVNRALAEYLSDSAVLHTDVPALTLYLIDMIRLTYVRQL
jgi:hypothetical protein